MQVTVIRKNELNIFTLPKEINGNFWITDYENGRKINLVNIEATKEGWQLVSNQSAYVVDQKNIMVPYVILRDYSFYLLNNNYKNEKYYIYCSPVYDATYKEFGIGTKPITVGSGSDNEISYGLNGVPKKSFSFQKVNQGFVLSIMDPQSAVYVNHKRVLQSKAISYGDIIFSFGLKIIPMRRDGVDYLLVNNPGGLLNFNASFVNIVPKKSDFVDDHTELNDDVSFQGDFFYRTPHFYKRLEKYILHVDSPPAGKSSEGTPAILTIGPMLTMSMTSIITLLSTFNSIGKGQSTVESSLTSLVMGVAMLATCLLWPLITRAYQKHADKKYEKKRQKAYRKYIDKKEEEINAQLIIQKNTLLDNYFSVSKCQEIIRGHNIQLWQRRITDNDFLTLPVGYGNLPMQIEISYPEEHFSLVEDNLLDMVHELGQKKRILNDVPIVYSFFSNISTGVVGNSTITKAFIDRVVLQIMANYSYDEVKIVTFTSKDNENSWDYIKTIPHSWSNDRTMRFFGSSNDDYREMIYHLEKIFQQRRAQDFDSRKMPHYIIITDAIKSIDSYDFIKNIMTTSGQLGFSIIMLVDRISALPNECKSFMEVSAQECSIFQSVLNSYVQKFYLDPSSIDDIYRCAEELANIPIDIKSETEASLPNTYQFLEMYQVGKVSQLNSLERWKKSNPVLSLQAPIGIGKSGETICLDLHEKYHGPHGLIAGTTGSGKSEFIITFILSLAVNYHPYEVQVILIDYKGGSLAGAFLTDQYRLPHLAGTITNLDGNELNRSLASIESEVKRRQRMFNDAKVAANESTIDIYKYQKLWREGKLKNMEPISHLFIISDEFAELKEQQPEFMDKLISIARVGRSLGVHLILATQKPGGVVDAQIWSNTRFRVCLKVQDTSDSQEVLKKPDAAYLKRTGRFYLQVGYDEVYTLGQSAWAGGQYYPNTTFKKDVDASVNTINNIAYITTTKENDVKEVVQSLGEELPNVVKYLSDIASDENIRVRRLWLDKIPARIYIDSLKNKYHFERNLFELNPIIGEYDDPSSQNQYLLNVPFTKLGNVAVYGIAGSGKENFLTSLIYSCMSTYAPEEVNFYVMDFGAETLRMFKDSPYVGDIVYVNDQEKLKNLFKMLFQELEHRKELFANYGGTYQSYIKTQKEHLPNLVVMINNYEVLSEIYEDYTESLAQITRDCFKYGIFFVITATAENALRYKIRQNISVLYALEQNSESDFSSILGNCRGKIPAKFKGRGLFRKDGIYEFQTAFVTKDDAQLNEFITNYCRTMSEKTSYRAQKIPILPKVVNYEFIKDELTSNTNFVVGVNRERLNIEKFAFFKTVHNFISAYETEDTYVFVKSLASEMFDLGCDFLFLNSTELDFSDTTYKDKVYKTGFEEVIDKISIYVEKVFQLFEEANFNKEVLVKQKNMICFFYGAQDILSKFSNDTFRKFQKIVERAKQMGIISFVFVDSYGVYRNYFYEEWFKIGSDLSRGIWIGSGISDQNLFKITKYTREDRAEISTEFGFVIHNGKLTRIKMLSDYQK
ncbi:MAG: type VII secretion protein EssC [Bacilli bacterium]|nr:type VII secretion protein EssC [Bacilli bacterium]